MYTKSVVVGDLDGSEKYSARFQVPHENFDLEHAIQTAGYDFISTPEGRNRFENDSHVTMQQCVEEVPAEFFAKRGIALLSIDKVDAAVDNMVNALPMEDALDAILNNPNYNPADKLSCLCNSLYISQESGRQQQEAGPVSRSMRISEMLTLGKQAYDDGVLDLRRFTRENYIQ